MSEQGRIGSKDSLKSLLIKNWATLALLGVALALLLLLIPRLTIWWALYWSSDSWKRLFYEDLGLSDALSTLFATILSFFYIFAWLPLAYLSWKRYDARKLAVLFVCWVFVEGTAPALHAAFGRDICFNQATGQPEKWYVVRNGVMVLSDSPGYDTQGAKRTPVTPQICRVYAEQQNGVRANLITQNPQGIEFFDPNTGLARVWYSRDKNGRYRLFDGPGFDPVAGTPLQPVTRDVVTKILSDAAEAAKRANAVPTVSPSFDCSSTSDPIPKLICQNSDLAEADNEMAAAYTTPMNAVPDSEALRQNQRDWLKMRNASPANANLILQQLNERTAYLRNVTQNAIIAPQSSGVSQATTSTTDGTPSDTSNSSDTTTASDDSQSPGKEPNGLGATDTFAPPPSNAYSSAAATPSYSPRPAWGRGSRSPRARGFFPAQRPAYVQQRPTYAQQRPVFGRSRPQYGRRR